MALLRKQQIKDILEEDGRIRNLAFNRIRQNVGNFDKSSKPLTEDDDFKILDIDASVEKLSSLLTEKITAFSAIEFKKSDTFQAIKSFFSYGEVVNLYNKIVAVYLNEPKLSVKDLIKNKLQTISDQISILSNATTQLSQGVYEEQTLDKRQKKSVSFDTLRPEIFKAVEVYDRIDAQLRGNERLTLIRPEDISSLSKSKMRELGLDISQGLSGADADEKPKRGRAKSPRAKSRTRKIDDEDEEKKTPIRASSSSSSSSSSSATAQASPQIEEYSPIAPDKPPKAKRARTELIEEEEEEEGSGMLYNDDKENTYI
jgi:hypothetical protein